MMFSVLLLATTTLVVIILSRLTCISQSSWSFFSQFKSIVLVIAHPDDEIMFFSPTLASLLKMGVNVTVLCLSTGTGGGHGPTRKQEYEKVMEFFGIRQSDILDDPRVRDGFHDWDLATLDDLIGEKLMRLQADAVISFDVHGVSGHPNHCSLSRALERLCSKSSVTLVQLKSVPLIFKYVIPPIDILFNGDRYMTTFDFHLTSLKAMTLYKSQYVWYRRLFTIFSRYSYVNTLAVAK